MGVGCYFVISNVSGHACLTADMYKTPRSPLHAVGDSSEQALVRRVTAAILQYQQH